MFENTFKKASATGRRNNLIRFLLWFWTMQWPVCFINKFYQITRLKFREEKKEVFVTSKSLAYLWMVLNFIRHWPYCYSHIVKNRQKIKRRIYKKKNMALQWYPLSISYPQILLRINYKVKKSINILLILSFHNLH